MPRGGQISAGSGLQLQSTSPGTKDIGNFNISGIGRSTGGSLGAIGPYLDTSGFQTPCIYGLYQTFRFPGTNALDSCVVGNGITLGSLSGYGDTSCADNTVIGNGNNVGSRGNTLIGATSQADAAAPSAGGAVGFHVVIGRSTIVQSDYVNNRGLNVVVGANSQVVGGALVALGAAQLISNKTGAGAKGGIYIGQYIRSDAGTNQIIIDSSSTGSTQLPDESRSNLIKIGDASHSTVEIGGKTLPVQYNYWGNQNVKVTYGNSVAETTIVSMVPVIRNLASTTQIRITAEGYVSCTGTPTLQLKVKWGIAATVLITSAATALPAGLANAPFKLDFALTIGTNPSATTPVLGTGTLDIWTGAAWFSIPIFMTATANVDTQVVNNPNNGLWISAIWGTAAPGNTLTVNSASTEGRFNYQ